MLNELGYDSISLTGWQAGIYTNNTNQNAIIECIDTTRILQELNNRRIVIIAGFQGINDNLDITTLGRGGSDTTAVAVAAAIKAKHCYIFSDVDGVYTTDPNKYSDAKKLDSLSYVEMIDIANEGAKVLHNRCIEIGQKFNIPIITKSTFNNQAGSVITEKIEDNIVKSIVKNDDVFLIGLKYDVYSIDLLNFVYEALVENNILPVQFFNRSGSVFNVSFLIKACDMSKLKKMLENELKGYCSSITNVSKIAVVGYGITSDSAFLKEIIRIVKEFNVSIYSIDITNTKIIITFDKIVDNNLLEVLHETIFKAAN